MLIYNFNRIQFLTLYAQCTVYTQCVCVYIVLYNMYQCKHFNASRYFIFLFISPLLALARFKYFNPNWFLVWQIPEQQSNYEAWSACIWTISSSDWAESQQKSYRSIANRPLHQA